MFLKDMSDGLSNTSIIVTWDTALILPFKSITSKNIYISAKAPLSLSGHHRDPHLRTPAGGWTRIHRGGGAGRQQRGGAHDIDPSPCWLSQLPRKSREQQGNSTSTPASWSRIHGHRVASIVAAVALLSSTQLERHMVTWTTPELAEAPATPTPLPYTPNNGSACHNPGISPDIVGICHLMSLIASPVVPATLPRH